MLPVQFRAILRRRPFSRAQSRLPTWERSFYNFRMRLLPIFVIWPTYTNCAISRNSETATSFARLFAHANISAPPQSAPSIIFGRDVFQYSLFGLNILPVRFRAINRRQPFLRTQSCTLISRLSQKCTFCNFLARLHPIFVIWPKYATRAISHDSDTVTFLARAIAHANILALLGVLLL